MDKDEIITQVANDILNTLNIGQIVNIIRENSVERALAYYDSLNEEQMAELINKIKAAKDQSESEEKVEVAETEVVS